MVDVFMELSVVWVHVGLFLPVLACLAYENIKLHRMHVNVNRTVLDTDTKGRVDTVPLSSLWIQVRPKIPNFRDKSCQDDDNPNFVV